MRPSLALLDNVLVAPRRQSFTEFCAWLGVTLEPGQRALARVAFDGREPCQLPPDERELARILFGPDVDRIPAIARRNVMIVCGARSGKSYLFVALRMLHLALTTPLKTLAPGEVASVNITAPDLDLAEQDLNYIRGAINQRPELIRLAVSGHEIDSKAMAIVLHRPEGRVTIACRAASSRGKTGRGRTLVGFAMDEASFFFDNDHKVNDRDVYDAQAPRVVPGGQGVVASTPWAEDGLLFEKYRDNWNAPKDCLVAHAPTLVMRTDPTIQEMIRLAYANASERDNAEREFGARFLSASAGRFFEESALAACVDDALPLDALPEPGDSVTAGADFGFTQNSSALAIVHKRGELCRLAVLVERKPEPGRPLKVSETTRDFAALASRHQVEGLMADAHYKEAIREYLEDESQRFYPAPEGLDGKQRTYVRARQLMREGKLRLPAHGRLLRQLRAVVAKPTSGGGLSISAQRAPDGSHGDLVSALVLALWQAHGTLVVAPDARVGSAEYWQREEARYEARMEVQVKRHQEGDEMMPNGTEWWA